MQMMIASSNAGKVREIREYFSDLPVEVLTERYVPQAHGFIRG